MSVENPASDNDCESVSDKIDLYIRNLSVNITDMPSNNLNCAVYWLNTSLHEAKIF